jgi:predicted permease
MFWHDLRYALRQLRRAPGFALTVTLTLALGIGASSAIFCIMDALWLTPMHVQKIGRIVRVFATTPQNPEGMFSYPEYRSMARRITAFHGNDAGLVAVGGRGSLMARPDGTSTLLTTNVVSSNFFNVMGVHPYLGRLFTPQDVIQMRVRPGVVLGYRCWQRDFGGDPNIVGRGIPLRRGKDIINQVDVWGVLPPSFRDIDPDSDHDLWMPAATWAALGSADLKNNAFRWLNLLGRLAPGATAHQASGQSAAALAALAADDPADNHNRAARAISDFDYRMSQAGTSGVVLLAIVCAVMLLAIVNVAQILIARAFGRAPEMALRLSLGAQRWTVARQLLIENLLLCAFSFLAGLGVAAGITTLLPRLILQRPDMLASFGYTTGFHLDLRVFIFAALLAFTVMLLLALVPLGQAARAQLLPVLQMRSALSTAGKAPLLRRAAVWLQIGVTFALLVSMGVLVRSFLNTRTQPLGITRGQVLLAWTQEPGTSVRNEVVQRLQSIPGVTRVAYAIRSPLSLSEYGIAIKVLLPSHPEIRDPIAIKFNAVSPNYLEVIGTPIMRGRGFTAADDRSGPLPVIVNQAMAEKYWPGQDPLGQTVRIPWAKLDAHVVGVAQNAVINRIGEPPEPYIYVPFQQYVHRLFDMGEITFVLNTGQDAMSLAHDARQALIAVNPLLDPMMVTSLPELIRYSAGNYQMMAELVSALGLIGLMLAIVGLYGFLAFRVTQRQREIGIRMALGASREATAAMILRDTVRMAAVGLAIGAVLAIAAGRLESAALFGVRALDLRSFIAALAVLAAAMAAAAWLPARRAASIDPMQAIRTE